MLSDLAAMLDILVLVAGVFLLTDGVLLLILEVLSLMVKALLLMLLRRQRQASDLLAHFGKAAAQDAFPRRRVSSPNAGGWPDRVHSSATGLAGGTTFPPACVTAAGSWCLQAAS